MCMKNYRKKTPMNEEQELDLLRRQVAEAHSALDDIEEVYADDSLSTNLRLARVAAVLTRFRQGL
jgi:hypothetical protein